MSDQQQPSQSVERFFGGSPARVVVKLVLVSILVGLVMSALGLNPLRIIDALERFVQSIFAMGFDAIEMLWHYFLLGAAIVVPVWLILRISASRQMGGR